MGQRSETELVELVLAGDITSYGKLCDKYYNAIVAIAYSVVSDDLLAEDAAQETFARALGNIGKLKSKEKFGSWLAGICKNVAKDMLKVTARNSTACDISQIADETGQEHDNQAVRQAINSLRSADRELIVLRYYNDLSHEQMANVTGLTKPAVNNRLNRARRKIAKYLKINGFTGFEL